MSNTTNTNSKRRYFINGLCIGGLGFLLWIVIAPQFKMYSSRLAEEHIEVNLYQVFLACRAYWADSGSESICNVDVATQTSYGYTQTGHVVIWGKGGNEYDFNFKGKIPKGDDFIIHGDVDGVYSLEDKAIKGGMDIRRLEDEELKSALAELNKLEDSNQTP